MPRHRKPHIPRHRALRPVGQPTRRARLSAAIGRGRHGPDRRPAERLFRQLSAGMVRVPDHGPAERLFRRLTAWMVRVPGYRQAERLFRRLSAGMVRVPGYRQAERLFRRLTARITNMPGHGPEAAQPERRSRILRGAARSLVVTPWVAAGAGLVLAAGLWLAFPHTRLRFPAKTTPDEVPCAGPACGGTVHGQVGGSIAVSTPGVPLPQSSDAGVSGSSRRTGASGLVFSFTVWWRRGDNFGALVKVSGPDLPAGWHLTFTLPGDRIGMVSGAQWQAAPGDDGGTASQEMASQSASSQGGQQSTGQNISFMMFGSGRDVTPTGCVFNGADCTFG